MSNDLKLQILNRLALVRVAEAFSRPAGGGGDARVPTVLMAPRRLRAVGAGLLERQVAPTVGNAWEARGGDTEYRRTPLEAGFGGLSLPGSTRWIEVTSCARPRRQGLRRTGGRRRACVPWLTGTPHARERT